MIELRWRALDREECEELRRKAIPISYMYTVDKDIPHILEQRKEDGEWEPVKTE